MYKPQPTSLQAVIPILQHQFTSFRECTASTHKIDHKTLSFDSLSLELATVSLDSFIV